MESITHIKSFHISIMMRKFHQVVTWLFKFQISQESLTENDSVKDRTEVRDLLDHRREWMQFSRHILTSDDQEQS